MIRLTLLTVAILAFAGCKSENPDYCPSNPGMQGCPPDASSSSCSSKADCHSVDSPVCDTSKNGGTCVACTSDDHGACDGNAPRCENEQCVACVDDTQDCGQGGLCLSTGACASAASIIHASSSSIKTDNCGDAGNACSLVGALALATPSKNVIKLDDAGPYIPDTNFVVNADVTIDMRGATLNHKADNVPLLEIMNNRTVALLGGTITGAHGNNGDGIHCTNATLALSDTGIMQNDQSGINASNCTLNVTRVNIHDNSKASGSTLFAGISVAGGSISISQSQTASNRGGGITISNNAKFVVVGNAFIGNGDPGGNTGGLSISTSTSGNRLEFNTFSGNKSQTGVAPGIQCVAAAGFVAQNNIVWNNNMPATVQVGGGCLHAYSDIGPIPVPSDPLIPNLDGGHNFNSDPKFAGADLPVNSMSPVRGKANPAADLSGIASKDIKGNARVMRTGAGADLGAYVVPEQ